MALPALMLIGIVCTEPGGSKVMIVAFCAKEERVRIEAHRVRKKAKANFREIVRATRAREDSVAVMLTPGQSERNATHSDAGGGKKVYDVFLNRLARGKVDWPEGFIDLTGDFYSASAFNRLIVVLQKTCLHLVAGGKTFQFHFHSLDGLNVNDETKQPEAAMFKDAPDILRFQRKLDWRLRRERRFRL